jgi:hypothetical protein
LSDEDAEIFKYAKKYNAALKDEVQFAKKILSFHPYPYQEEFLRDQSPRIAACCGRQVGKTTLAAIKALHFALANRKSQVLIVSAGLRQSMILFADILRFIDESMAATTMLDEKTRTKVKFANGSEIVALPCGRDGSTLRGFTCDMAILDECNFIPRIVIDSVIRPTTITKPNARTIMLSTPWIKDHPFYEAITKPEQGFKTYGWPSAINPQITKERLELEKRTIGEYDFDREYNAHFIDDQSSYFPSKLVLACTDAYLLNEDPSSSAKYEGDCHVGIDFGKHNDHSAIAILERTVEEDLRLVYLKEFELGTPYTAVIGTVKRLNAAYRFTCGYLDQTGVGEGPYEQIHQDVPRVRGITLTLQTKENILGKLRLIMENELITIPRDDQRLLTQITSQRSEPTTSGNLKFCHPTGANDDLLWALALATYSAQHPRIPNMIMGVKRQW